MLGSCLALLARSRVEPQAAVLFGLSKGGTPAGLYPESGGFWVLDFFPQGGAAGKPMPPGGAIQSRPAAAHPGHHLPLGGLIGWRAGSSHVMSAGGVAAGGVAGVAVAAGGRKRSKAINADA